ncbi:hypothetical protein FRB91_002738, partial [Serendipita sp. 411]
MTRLACDIPVELWLAIFDLVLKTWLVPHPDFDLIDSMKFLQLGCSSILEYFRIERVRTNLRLVCKQWNTILSVATINLAVEMDPNPTSVPNYARISERLHIVDTLCSCGFVFSREKCKARQLLARRQQAVEENYDNAALSQKKFQTRVFRTDSLSPERLEGFLESDPPLQALAITSHAFVASRKLHSSATIQRITHLRLNYEPGTIDEIVPVALPNLVTLDYDVYLATFKPEVFNGPAIMGSWSVPKLKTLILRQVAISGKLPPSFSDFILSHKSTLVELIIYCTTTDYAGREANSLLELISDLPNLEIFGMDAQALLRKSPDLNVKYHTNRQRTLLLDRFSLISINNDVVERIKRSFRTLFMTKGLFTRI